MRLLIATLCLAFAATGAFAQDKFISTCLKG
jgi:hypothetical protein